MKFGQRQGPRVGRVLRQADDIECPSHLGQHLVDVLVAAGAEDCDPTTRLRTLQLPVSSVDQRPHRRPVVGDIENDQRLPLNDLRSKGQLHPLQSPLQAAWIEVEPAASAKDAEKSGRDGEVVPLVFAAKNLADSQRLTGGLDDDRTAVPVRRNDRPADDVERSVPLAGDPVDDRGRFRWKRPGYDWDCVLDDAGLLSGDRVEAVAKDLTVVVADAHDGGRDRPADVCRIEPATESDLEHDQIAPRLIEGDPAEGGPDLEERQRLVACIQTDDNGPNDLEGGRQLGIADRLAADSDSFVEPFDVRRGEPPDPIAAGTDGGVDQMDDRPLALRPGDMDAGHRKLRVAKFGQQSPHPIEFEVAERIVAGREPLEVEPPVQPVEMSGESGCVGHDAAKDSVVAWRPYDSAMTALDFTIDYLELTRAKTAALLQRVRNADAGDWRPGPGRAHCAWQLMHIGVTEEKFASARLHGRDPKNADLVQAYGHGSVPSDDIPAYDTIADYLTESRSILVEAIRGLEGVDLSDKPDSMADRGWSYADAMKLLVWHEGHHQGQGHLTMNLFDAQSEAGGTP